MTRVGNVKWGEMKIEGIQCDHVDQFVFLIDDGCDAGPTK